MNSSKKILSQNNSSFFSENNNKPSLEDKTIFTGKFRDEDFIFEEEPNDGIDENNRQGSCAYIALGITREEVYKVLSNMNFDQALKIRDRIGAQILNDYYSDQGIQRINLDDAFKLPLLENLRMFASAQAAHSLVIKKYFDLYKNELNTQHVDAKMLISILQQKPNSAAAIKEIENAELRLATSSVTLNINLTQPNLIKNYILREVMTEWAGSNMLLAWAICVNRTLRIWGHQNREENSKEIFVGNCLSHLNPKDTKPIDIIHTWGNTHFQKLEKVTKFRPEIIDLSNDNKEPALQQSNNSKKHFLFEPKQVISKQLNQAEKHNKPVKKLKIEYNQSASTVLHRRNNR